MHEIYREWRAIMNEYDGDRMMVAEAWVPKNRQHLYVRPDEMHQIFNFGFLQAGWSVETLTSAIMEPLTFANEVGAPTTWVLSNHDTIRHATRYGFDHGYRFGEGLSREEKPDFELGVRRARAATALMLALPGSAYLYQGEELGLPEVADIPDELREDPAHKRAGVPGRDGCRVPLPDGRGVAPPARDLWRTRRRSAGWKARFDARDVPHGPAPASRARTRQGHGRHDQRLAR